MCEDTESPGGACPGIASAAHVRKGKRIWRQIRARWTTAEAPADAKGGDQSDRPGGGDPHASVPTVSPAFDPPPPGHGHQQAACSAMNTDPPHMLSFQLRGCQRDLEAETVARATSAASLPNIPSEKQPNRSPN